MPAEQTAAQLATLIGGEIQTGDPETKLIGITPTDHPLPGTVTFVSKTKFLSCLAETSAAAVILAPEMVEKEEVKIPSQVVIITVQQPYVAFAKTAQIFADRVPAPQCVHGSAVIDETARLGEGVSIGPFVYLGPNVSIGDGAVLYAGVHVEADATVGPGAILYNHVVIRHSCHVGARSILHPGVVIGSDGFGFAQEQRDGEAPVHVKIPQVGNVQVEEDVEIGANCTVDRAALGTTVIGAGTKIDNLVQIAHNVQIGQRCILVAQSGVAGSSRLGNGVILAAQAGVAGHLSVGDGAVVGGQAGVIENIPDGADVIGAPAIAKRTFFRNVVRVSKLDTLFARVKKLERRLQESKNGDEGA